MHDRESQRVGIRFPCAAQLPGSTLDVVVLDITPSGCRLATASGLAKIGATIVLLFSDRLDAAGQIVWRDEWECGVMFHEHISENTIDWLAAQSE
ncbi:PilZ domain-containing protein [Aurantiacibacter poecillastricola]|uniref:PilZ domain-containing protein n=1 Tax=Aurantiacibacter poecillastricola TaxID=3064385 RepID=UPI0035307EDF